MLPNTLQKTSIETANAVATFKMDHQSPRRRTSLRLSLEKVTTESHAAVSSFSCPSYSLFYSYIIPFYRTLVYEDIAWVGYGGM